VSSRVFHWAAENECKDIVDEPATAQAKEETAHSLTAREVGALTTLKTFASSPWKGTKMMVVHLAPTHFIRELLGMSGLKKGSVGAVGE
jgi:hypothetical protein